MKFLFTTILLALVSCQKVVTKNDAVVEISPPPPAKESPPPQYPNSKVEPLTKIGESTMPRFSPDGTRIIYVSGHRPDHENRQVYEMVLTTQKERRITHHDGDDSSPLYHPKKPYLFYASTTDEIKEKLELDKWALASGKISSDIHEQHKTMADIYESKLDGSSIQRLTQTPGYDSELTIDPNGRHLVFSSVRSGELELYLSSIPTKFAVQLTHEKGESGGPSYSFSGKQLAWSHFNKGETASQIVLGNDRAGKKHDLTTAPARSLYPSWHPNNDEIIFSSDRNEKGNLELYVLNVKTNCLKRLTYQGGDDIYPVFSPDGKKVLFASNRTGLFQIYLMDYTPPPECAKETP